MNYNLLVEAWKKHLEEGDETPVGDFALWVKDDKDAVLIYDYRKMIEIIFSPESTEQLSNFSNDKMKYFPQMKKKILESGALVAGLSMSPAPENTCMNAFLIDSSAVHKAYRGKKMGTFLYYIAMELARPHPLASARGDALVSDSARRVWRSISKKKNVIRVPSGEGEYMDVFDDQYNPQTPPKNDDCPLDSEHELNAAYTTNHPQIRSAMKKMVAKHEVFMKVVISKTEKMSIRPTPAWFPDKDAAFNMLRSYLFEDSFEFGE